MPTIHLTTEINSTMEICFDLSRSIDLHTYSMQHTQEEAIAGKTSGLIDMDETVTWQAKHFGLMHFVTSKITNYQRPLIFRDEQTKGIFDYFRHDHIFENNDGKIMMKDVFEFKSPFGFLGKIADFLFLKKYMTNLLLQRNKVIKEFAESDKWKEVLSNNLSMNEDIKFKVFDFFKSKNFIVEYKNNYILTLGKQIVVRELEADKYEILYEKPLHETNRIYSNKNDILHNLENITALLESK